MGCSKQTTFPGSDGSRSHYLEAVASSKLQLAISHQLRMAQGELNMTPVHINSKFFNNLANTFGTKRFTTKEAYKLYERDHWISHGNRYEYIGPKNEQGYPDHYCTIAYAGALNIPIHPEHWRKRTNKEIRKARKQKMDNWGEMNTRNTLCAAVQCGLLVRVEKGIYTFKGTF